MRAMAVTVVAICAVLAASCSSAPASGAAAAARHAGFAHRAELLEQRWDSDVRDGVPAASIAPLRAELARSLFRSTPASSPTWLSNDSTALLDSLDRRTASAWDAAMAAARQAAIALIAARSALAAQDAAAVTAGAPAAGDWPAELSAARTPGAINALAAGWWASLGQARASAAASAQLAAQFAATVAPYGGVAGLIVAADGALTMARAERLDEGNVASLLEALQRDVAAASDVTAAVNGLLGPLQGLRALLGEHDYEAAQLGTLQQQINRAVSTATTHASGFSSAYGDIAAAFGVATNAGELNAVEARIRALQNQVNADLDAAVAAALAAQLSATGCGNKVPMGKVVVVSLSQQVASFFQNTCLLSSTPVTTGRPGIRTPQGTFHVFGRSSPAHFVSAYGPGSPRYYTPETTQYALLYEGGGYYLHDAPWENPADFGAGSENGPSGSHGCIHVPTATMAWLYSWAGMGTTVIVTG
ncbi:MAG: hypothetical protein DLM65_08705 [Candidatus Aeolococcus gillhamiae]|uniref:L,D-TPase catalytic domain-containing protein n=3 Tax=Candidatus Aeolococcus gillhamiae TaxID=3127015 RepID=A0A2W5Z854_9BACT|nr:MAG: hypothetical protein DLM65_08705 [Candidatus Dormibacter sp. RRmetagenome_bin12]